jgi:hypothetical protein
LKAPAGKWVIKQDGKNRVVSQVDTQKQVSPRFALAVLKGQTFTNVRISARLKAISGYQAVGLVFRYQDPDNYNVARINTAEKNIQFLGFVNGVRTGIVAVPVPELKAGEWYTLKAAHNGPRIAVSLNDKQLFTTEDTHFKSGRVGLWIKDDTVAEWDDVQVQEVPPLPEKKPPTTAQK